MGNEVQFKLFINAKPEIWQAGVKQMVESHFVKNNIEISRNEDFDLKLIHGENGYLYYEYEAIIYPIVDTNFNDQLLLYNNIKTLLKSKNVFFEMVSAFEN